MTPLGLFFQRALESLPRRTVEDFLTSSLKIDRLTLYTDPNYLVDEALLNPKLERLIQGEPLAYILGETAFLGCLLKVTPDVLIPRQETELFAAWILTTLKKKSGVLVDLCTGSGCLGIALKKHLPSFEVVLTDLSEKALAVAEENAYANGVEVTLLLGDLFAPLNEVKIDVLVSNPPYVTLQEYDDLDPNIKNYEPSTALLAGEDGLLFYRRIQKELPPLINPEGELFLEIGSTQEKSVSDLFAPPFWQGTIVERDLSSHPRFVYSRHGLKSNVF